MPLFINRKDAGQKLAKKLQAYAGHPNLVVQALPRGGVPVAYEVARALHAPLDIYLVRKLGVPGHEELAMGAIASGGFRVLNDDLVRALKIPPEVVDQVTRREQKELERREQAYRGDRPRLELRGHTVILIDDGLATGASMRAAVAGIRAQSPAHIVVAVPTAAIETCQMFQSQVDEVVCATTPTPFFGVGYWYEDFSQTSDTEVIALLEQAARRQQTRVYAENHD
jgi:putative phosphoribosyl transferase